MSKIIVTTEEELEVLLKRVINETLEPLLVKDNNGIINTANEIMTIKEVSELLQISVQTLYGKTSARTIPHFKKGKKLYFKRNEILQWLTTDKRQTTDELLRDWEEKQKNKRKRY